MEELYLSKPLWYAKLDSGDTIIEDWERPACWLRLKERICLSGEKIVSLKIGFRSNIVSPLPENAEGYFFRNGIIAPLNGSETYGRFIIGYLKGETVYTELWKIPDIIKVKDELRDINNEELVGESLIRNYK